MAEMKKQFIKRVWEAPVMTQWIEIVEDGRTPMKDQSNRIPEKEFLLVHTHPVQTNTNLIELHDHQDTWICKGYLLSIDSTIFNRPRLRIHHDVWDPHSGDAEGDNAVHRFRFIAG
jgi:hypothetical protein